MVARLIRFSFSASGPFIISFGTYSGLLIFIEVFFGHKIPAPGSKLSYVAYLGFLYIAGFFLEQKTFDNGDAHRKEESTESKKDPKLIPKKQLTVLSFISGGYDYILNFVLEKNRISFYDVFERPKHWDFYDPDHKEFPIFRLEIGDRSVELRYPKNKKGKILVRETADGTHKYGPWSEKSLLEWKFLAVFAPFEFLKQLLF